MRALLPSLRLSTAFYTLLTLAIAVGLGVGVLNPIWMHVALPGMFPSNLLPPITAPVDGLYYLRNAELGYAWTTRDPLSFWFHPLLAYLLQILIPLGGPPNIWFWILGVFFAGLSLPLIYRLVLILTPIHLPSARLLPLCLLAPGGLGMATGNAEIPELFFAAALLFSVLGGSRWWITLGCALAAILTKPNALYLIPMLGVYFVAGIAEGDVRLWRQALIGIVGLLGGWLGWAWIVDLQTGYPGAYWEARESFKYYIAAGDARAFFEQLANAFWSGNNLRDQIRYSTALIIPIANLLVIGLIPLSQERHRYAMAAGTLTMLAITLYLGNPNKIVVYTTTLPGYFVAHLMLINRLLIKGSFPNQVIRFSIASAYTCYCLGMLVIYVLGTPLRWYH